MTRDNAWHLKHLCEEVSNVCENFVFESSHDERDTTPTEQHLIQAHLQVLVYEARLMGLTIE